MSNPIESVQARRRFAPWGLALVLASLLTAPALTQEPDAPDVPTLLRAADGSGESAAVAAEQLRHTQRETLAASLEQIARGCERARSEVLAARRERVMIAARVVVARNGARVAELRKSVLTLVRTYEKPQQPEVDRLVNELRQIVYGSIPEEQLVSEKFRQAHIRYDRYRELCERAGAPDRAGPALAPAIKALDAEWMLKAWCKGSHARLLDALEQHRDFLDPEELNYVAAANAYRALLGLRPHVVDRKLVLCGRRHSADMARLGFFSHTSPIKGREHYTARASQEGTSAATENIAAGQSTGAGAFEGWYHSPGHHRNILGSQTRTGAGRAGTLWTCLFG